MAKSKSSYACEKWWKIRVWQHKSLEDWEDLLLAGLDITSYEYKQGVIVCPFRWCHTMFMCCRMPKKIGIHLYADAQFFCRRPSLPSHRDALSQWRHPSKWHSPIDSQVARGRTERQGPWRWEVENMKAAQKYKNSCLGVAENKRRKLTDGRFALLFFYM